ncbi:ATP-binding cassette domain-containing protein [Rhizobium rhizogenes]|uniref:ATP-binding cassette domain-containing protein n=1 Tax=Rhizobium rhizogenes TaxID=359 RepID=UPI0028692BFE|nr:ATP-binding cassette domain-containing protein [Rhizobium rhizogenes]
MSHTYDTNDGEAVIGVDVSLDIMEGETLALIGESGSGKSTLGQIALNLLTPTVGKVRYQDQDLTTLTDREMRPIRRDLQMIFQDPSSALNPRMTIERAIADPIRSHGIMSDQFIPQRVRELLWQVGLDDRILACYPHQLSGGQCQRVVIARALACGPKFIMCDEATSALDVSIQAQILNLLVDIQKRSGMTYMFISHDLSVVRHFSDRIAVMFQGRLVELARTEDIFTNPRHAYTRKLLSVILPC